VSDEDGKVFSADDFDPELKEMMKKNIHAVSRSNVFLTLLSPKPEDLDLQQCLEVGAAVLLDKPFILVGAGSRYCPKNLMRMASAIVQSMPGDPTFEDELKCALMESDDKLREKLQGL
jgi:hypothetical protein